MNFSILLRSNTLVLRHTTFRPIVRPSLVIRLIKLIKKKIEENPKRWHEVLSEALWAHCISKHSATKVSPFELVYMQEAILPVEVNLDALQIAREIELSAIDYHNLMLDSLDEVSGERVKALGEIERDKLRVVKAYNKRVKEKLL
jgi:hypothetical protein